MVDELENWIGRALAKVRGTEAPRLFWITGLVLALVVGYGLFSGGMDGAATAATLASVTLALLIFGWTLAEINEQRETREAIGGTLEREPDQHSPFAALIRKVAGGDYRTHELSQAELDALETETNGAVMQAFVERGKGPRPVLVAMDDGQSAWQMKRINKKGQIEKPVEFGEQSG